MLVALGTISSQQSKATEQTYNASLWILNYANSNPNATIRYTASDMILYVHSDTLYLSVTRARSRAGGHYFLSNRSPDPTKPPRTRPWLNGTIHTVSKIMYNVMGSAAKAEISATYINGQEAFPVHTLFREIGHPQPATPMQVDNSTDVGFANYTIKQKRSKGIVMRFYLICKRTSHGQFLVYWQPGITDLADYHTKHHLPAHHLLMRCTYLYPTEQLANTVIDLLLQGCVNLTVHASPVWHNTLKPPSVIFPFGVLLLT